MALINGVVILLAFSQVFRPRESDSNASVNPRATLSETMLIMVDLALGVSGTAQLSIMSTSCHCRYPPGPVAQRRRA